MRFVRVIRVPARARVSRVSRLPPVLFTGTVQYTRGPRDAAGFVAFALRCRRLCSPPRFFATRALPVLARNQLPALSVASPLVVSTTDREPANFVLRMLAAGTLLAAIVQPEAAECVGTKRKKGTVVEEFYEVDCIKARRIVKGGAVSVAERMFSKAGKFYGEDKQRQEDGTLEHCLFASANTE